MGSPQEKIQAITKQLTAQQEPPAQTSVTPPTLEQRVGKLEARIMLESILEANQEMQIAEVKRDLIRTFQMNKELAKDILELRKDLNKVITLMTNINQMLENNPIFASGSKTMN